MIIVIIIVFIVAINLLHGFEQMTSLTHHAGLYWLSLLTSETDLNSHLLRCVKYSYPGKQPDINWLYCSSDAGSTDSLFETYRLNT